MPTFTDILIMGKCGSNWASVQVVEVLLQPFHVATDLHRREVEADNYHLALLLGGIFPYVCLSEEFLKVRGLRPFVIIIQCGAKQAFSEAARA